jgi:hypothetical protein
VLPPAECERFLDRVQTALSILEAPPGPAPLEPFEGDQGDRESEGGLPPFGPPGSLQ